MKKQMNVLGNYMMNDVVIDKTCVTCNYDGRKECPKQYEHVLALEDMDITLHERHVYLTLIEHDRFLMKMITSYIPCSAHSSYKNDILANKDKPKWIQGQFSEFTGVSSVERVGEWSGRTRVTIDVDGRDVPSSLDYFNDKYVKVKLENLNIKED